MNRSVVVMVTERDDMAVQCTSTTGRRGERTTAVVFLGGSHHGAGVRNPNSKKTVTHEEQKFEQDFTQVLAW